MEYCVERKINYYETDKMGIVHHSNYIRFLEEARCKFLEDHDMPFDQLEKLGVTVPVLSVECEYKYHVTYGDTILIYVYLEEYTGVKMTISYKIVNKENGNLVLTGKTKHCFTNISLRPTSLKKHSVEYHEKLLSIKE